jgi:dUTP pyrophosphatase
MNFSFFDKEVKKGDRVAQIMILPVASPELVESEELSETDRNQKGFGSSGM